MDLLDRPGDEPTLSREEWVEYGGELIWAVGFTPGGAPYGLTSRDFQRLNAQLEPRAGWARAKALLAWAFETCSPPGADVEVGRVKKIGDGLSRRVYAAHVDLSPDPAHLSGPWAVLLPDRQATLEDRLRWVREVAVLGQLARQPLSTSTSSALPRSGVAKRCAEPAPSRRNRHWPGCVAFCVAARNRYDRARLPVLHGPLQPPGSHSSRQVEAEAAFRDQRP